jgi:hypothetical protein
MPETTYNPCALCYDCLIPGQERPNDCPGLLVESKSLEGYPEDGYFVQVCPRVSNLGRMVTHIDYCGNGPDVIVMHQSTVPSAEEYAAAAKKCDNAW